MIIDKTEWTPTMELRWFKWATPVLQQKWQRYLLDENRVVASVEEEWRLITTVASDG